MNMKKRILIIISVFLSVILIAFGSVYFLFLHRYAGKNIVNNWNENDEFKIENVATVEKKKDKDLVILNLADIQLCDLEDLFHMRTVKNEITYLVRTVKPDLITLTGDQTWSNENLISLTSIIRWLDSFKIPYAPVFGNHDYGNEKNSAVASQNYCCDLYENGQYSLFKRGPTNIGTLGNYVINIVEEGKIIKTLYMLDSGYEDKITDEQIAWFKWNAEGIKNANNGKYPEGMCFFHKPIPEFSKAYWRYLGGESSVEVIGDVHVHYSLSGSTQNGFFDVAKTKNITDIVCGHQHGNNFTLKYENVRLTFALKTGELASYYDDGVTNLNGATVFRLSEDNVEVENIYVDRNMFHINGSNNIY